MVPTQLQGSNLTVARSPLATENDDGKLKTHSKVARLVSDFIYLFIIVGFLENIIWASENRSGQVKVLSLFSQMATKKKKVKRTHTQHILYYIHNKDHNTH